VIDVEPTRHPLAFARAQLGLSASAYLTRLDMIHRSLGYGAMARRREKVWRWEHDKAVPDHRTQLAMAMLHGVAPDEIKRAAWPRWLAAAYPLPVDTDAPGGPLGTVALLADLARGGTVDVDRRQFLVMTSGALGASVTRWNAALGQPVPLPTSAGRRVGTSVVDVIDRRLDGLRRLDDVLGSGELRELAARELSLITRLLERASYTQTVGRRLFSLAAEAARQAGWLSFDTGYHAAAQSYFAAALRASGDAADALTGAYAASFWAIQCYSAGDPRDAVALLNAAHAQTLRLATPRFDAMLAARTARSYSKIGDPTACQRSLDRARNALAAGPHDDDPPYLYWVTLGEVEMIAGSSALELGDPTEALRRFDDAMRHYNGDEQYPRTHAIYLSRAADAHLRLRDLDQAVSVAQHAVRCLGGVDSARSSDTLADLRTKFDHYRDIPTVRDFLAATT
jgi:tetratricopeptide (TPR) repeat protein